METSVNNKCKAFTSLEQSRKLAEILPLESADMLILNNVGRSGNVDGTNCSMILKENLNPLAEVSEILPCWSLAAMLSVLPDYTLQTNTDGTVFVVCDSKKPMISDAYDNPVDACVAMIEKLNELNLL